MDFSSIRLGGFDAGGKSKNTFLVLGLLEIVLQTISVLQVMRS